MGYIYLIRNCENNTYKVGVSKNEPQKRLKQLQTGCSYPLDLLHSFETNYPYRLEKMLHIQYSSQKEYGEWFKLDNEQVSNFLNTCKKLQNTIDGLLQNPFFSKGIK